MSVWRRLFGRRRTAVPLTPDRPDGSYVQVTGIARALPDVETIVAPVSGLECVVARVKFAVPMAPSTQGGRPPTRFERFHNRPFAVESDGLHVIVDAAHLELEIAARSEGSIEETSVPHGMRVTVSGTLLRDGASRPEDGVAFRETQTTYRLVGNKQHPVVITASVSDDDGG